MSACENDYKKVIEERDRKHKFILLIISNLWCDNFSFRPIHLYIALFFFFKHLIRHTQVSFFVLAVKQYTLTINSGPKSLTHSDLQSASCVQLSEL